MEDNFIKLMFLLVLSIALISCQQKNSGQELLESIDYIENISNLQFPTKAKLLTRRESERGGSKTFIRRIIYSKREFNKKHEQVITVKSQAAFDSLRENLEGKDIGTHSGSVLSSSWIDKNGEWLGIWLDTSNGFYLDLQQVVTVDNL